MSGYHEPRNFSNAQDKESRPTTMIKDDEVQRVRELDSGFCKAAAVTVAQCGNSS